jgi:GNAT superfamily N-acetyltransferase
MMAPVQAPASRIWVAEKEDLEAVAGLLAEFRDHMGGSAPPLETIRDGVGRILAGGDGEYLLAAPGEGDEAAGVVQLRYRWSVWTGAPDCWLEDLFIRESARRGGMGRALVEASFERAHARGCKRIELDTNEQNEAAIALYEACGFSTRPKGSDRSLFLGRKL